MTKLPCWIIEPNWNLMLQKFGIKGMKKINFEFFIDAYIFIQELCADIAKFNRKSLKNRDDLIKALISIFEFLHLGIKYNIISLNSNKWNKYDPMNLVIKMLFFLNLYKNRMNSELISVFTQLQHIFIPVYIKLTHDEILNRLSDALHLLYPSVLIRL